MSEQQRAPWLALIGALSAICAALASRVVSGIPDILPAAGGVFIAVFVLLAYSMAGRPLRSATIGVVSLIFGGTWASYAAWVGLSPLLISVVGLFAVALMILEIARRRKAENLDVETVGGIKDFCGSDRNPEVNAIEALFQRVTKKKVIVTDIRPWDDPRNGVDVYVDLPENFTPRMLADYTDRIQSSRTLRLPQGCVVTVVDGKFQCEAIVSIMKRDCLQDHIMLDEPTTPASINDHFDLLRSPQGFWFKIRLRIHSMIIGGTVGSGKTTLLNRIIAYLARCTDCLIWVVDFNGGGLGAPWTRLYEEGKTTRPIIDWVADNEVEAAVLMACAYEVGVKRKTDRECVEMRRAANSNVLPVSAQKPAIIVITDEGGEVRKAASILGMIVCDRISQLAQIGRAEAVRVIISVLRGTADFLDKGLRAVCSIRVCLRMDEEGEADHVLGRCPGRTHLLHTGSAWLYRSAADPVGDPRPILGCSVDVAPEAIEAYSVAVQHLRPELDPAGQRVCQRVTLTDVFNGNDPDNFPDLLGYLPLRDVAAGRAYAGRWERRIARLRAIEQGEDPNQVTNGVKTSASHTSGGVESSAGSRLSSSIAKMMAEKRSAEEPAQPTTERAFDEIFNELTEGQNYLIDGRNPKDEPRSAEMPEAQAQAQETVPDVSEMTLRQHLLIILAAHAPDGLRAGQLEKELTTHGVSYSRKNLFDQLKKLVASGSVTKAGDQYSRPSLA